MNTQTAAFPAPSSLQVLPGTEQAQAAYPYYMQFTAADDARFWFYNSMHFPEPMSAFDMVTAEAAYCALGSSTTRVHCIPTTLGIDYRIINGRVYIGGNAVTDPAQIARRTGEFQQRAFYYYGNWERLYAQWREKMLALIREAQALPKLELPEFEPLANVHAGRGIAANHALLDIYQKTLEGYFRMWHHHFEFLLLGYGHVCAIAEEQELEVVVPHPEVALERLLVDVEERMVCGNAAPGVYVRERLEFRQLELRKRLGFAYQRQHLLAPLRIQALPVAVVVEGALLELAGAAGDLRWVRHGVAADVDSPVDDPVVDPERGRQAVHARGGGAESTIRGLGRHHVERRHRFREMHRVVEPEPRIVRGSELHVVGVGGLRPLGTRKHLQRARGRKGRRLGIHRVEPRRLSYLSSVRRDRSAGED